MPGVVLFAVLPFNVRARGRRFGFEHRIHRWQNGEHQGLEKDDGLNAEPAKIPRLLRRDTLHSSKLRAAGGTVKEPSCPIAVSPGGGLPGRLNEPGRATVLARGRRCIRSRPAWERFWSGRFMTGGRGR